MENINWIQVGIGFISGGAFGALIKQFFDNRRNRIQPVSCGIQLKSFYDSFENKLLKSKIILTDGEKEFKFCKLYTGSVRLVNSGLSDYNDFVFGLTCPNIVKFIHVKAVTADKHHIAEIKETPTLNNQISTFDINLKPFNRKDDYTLDILIGVEEGNFVNLTADDIKISSPYPIKFVDIVSTSKIILDVARETIISFGPISVDYRK